MNAATTAAVPKAADRRLLMIARDYPPANTAGALRPLKFARYLPEFGWQTSVVTVRAGFHPSTDPGLLRQIPRESRVYRAFGFDTKRVLAIRGRYPGFLALPDRSVSWLPCGVLAALRAVRRERIDALLSTSPPETAHCIGLLVQRITKLPWVVDLRDPWTAGPSNGRVSRWANRRLERQVVLAADRIVVPTPGLVEDLGTRFREAADEKVRLVYNGYDEADFQELRAAGNGPAECFTIAHVGQVHPVQRDPRRFLEAVRHSLDCGRLPTDTGVVFVGAGERAQRVALERLAQRLGLGDIVRLVEWVSRQEALATMLRASVLLLLQGGDEFRTAIPSKAFEYLRSGRYILTVAPADSDTASLMRPFAGVFIASDSRAEIEEKLVAAYQAWSHTGQAGGCQQRDLADYTRRAGAGELVRILDELCAPQ